MKRKDMVLLAMIMVIAAGLAGCQEDTNTLHVATQWKGTDSVPMGTGDYASYGWWYFQGTLLDTLTGLVWSCVLVGMPLAIIIGVTGLQFGKHEMRVEGLLIAALGALLLAVGPYRELGMGAWVVILTIVPGLLITLWRKESGKIFMFLGLDAVFAAALIYHCFSMNPWRVGIVIAILLVLGVMASVFLGDDEKKPDAAPAHH